MDSHAFPLAPGHSNNEATLHVQRSQLRASSLKRLLLWGCGIVLLLAPVAPAYAQRGTASGSALAEATLTTPSVTAVTLTTGIEQRFDAGLETDGEVNVLRLNVGGQATTNVSSRWKVGLGATYTFTAYAFSGTMGLGGLDPWEDIHQVTVSVPVSYQVSTRWSLFGAPIMQFNAEAGANLRDAFTGGGLFGASYKVNEHLTLGGGLGGISQIEDDILLFPVLLVQWQIDDRLRLGLRGNAARGAGAVLSYRLGAALETAVGVSFESRRFRLNDDGVAPHGVGEASSLPIWAQVSYKVLPHLTIDVYGGVAVAGKLELEDRDGNRLRTEDVDPAPFMGVVATIPF